MVDLVITPSDVQPSGSTLIEHGTAGAVITAGKVVYKDATDGNKFKLADSDGATEAVKQAYGIALNDAASGQPLAVARSGDITLSAVMTAGDAYYLSAANPGGIAPRADLAAGDDVVQIGIAKSTSVLALRIINPGVTL